ncbi:MAG: 1-acyl-sn-glycerol-3-phosphate acyltransferase [Lachnospiraceae bacterium]|nr:1-acyl-sn-glycerol-3-phosphate acyltransferase [Lachnospiraceae bacterium]
MELTNREILPDTRFNPFKYGVFRFLCFMVTNLLYRCRYLRNELRGVKGPYVVIANHQSMLDAFNLVNAAREPLHLVVSQSFYNGLPVHDLLTHVGLIPKQQFQDSPAAIRAMKQVLKKGEPLAIYPAGLMCEDGLSTPIPRATYKFLKWLGEDVYMARTAGAYFVMPKWSKGVHPGTTTMDVYKLFSKEELDTMTVEQVQERAEEALSFDAYREQEQSRYVYSKASDLSGLENVLYRCPDCGEEFTMTLLQKDTLGCSACGYRIRADKYGLLEKTAGKTELRYVSDWNLQIQEAMTEEIKKHPEFTLTQPVEIRMIDYDKHTYVPVGTGELTFSYETLSLKGVIGEEPAEITMRTKKTPALPFSPGKYLELQDPKQSYRCVLKDGRQTMKFINYLKAVYRLQNGV